MRPVQQFAYIDYRIRRGLLALEAPSFVGSFGYTKISSHRIGESLAWGRIHVIDSVSYWTFITPWASDWQHVIS